jgi:hypothetical protein
MRISVQAGGQKSPVPCARLLHPAKDCDEPHRVDRDAKRHEAEADDSFVSIGALKAAFGLRPIVQYFSGTNFRPFSAASSS